VSAGDDSPGVATDGVTPPTRRELLRPVEYVGGAAIAAVFVGVIVFGATRQWNLTLIAAGVVFIVVLMVTALVAMVFKPDGSELAALAKEAAEDRAEREKKQTPTPE